MNKQKSDVFYKSATGAYNTLCVSSLRWFRKQAEVTESFGRGFNEFSLGIQQSLWRAICLKITTIYLKGCQNMSQAFWSPTLSMHTYSNIFPFKWKILQAQNKVHLFLMAWYTSKLSGTYFRERRPFCSSHSAQWVLSSKTGNATVDMTEHRGRKGEIFMYFV